MKQRGLTTFVTLAAALTWAQPAWAGRWTVQNVPVAGSGHGRLLSVSCTRPDACTAVGSFDTGVVSRMQPPNTAPLVERWNGHSWSAQTLPFPDEATLAELTGVSCPALHACLAVGDWLSFTTGHWAPIAERWDGSSWTLQTLPRPATAAGFTRDTQPEAVSCSAPTACTTVGTFNDSSGNLDTLAERFDGTSWSVQTTPTVSGTNADDLRGVSCPSASNCTAVGDAQVQGLNVTSQTLAEHWNGTSWSIQATPNPSGASFSLLNAVSCASRTRCTAVGRSDADALAERWNGSSWAIQSTPVTGGQSSSLSSVSCLRRTDCTAVGLSTDSDGVESSLAEHWNGASWTTRPTPSPGDGAELAGVSCSVGTCFAVGRDLDNASQPDPSVPLVERHRLL
jgi:hypothetical protein